MKNMTCLKRAICFLLLFIISVQCDAQKGITYVLKGNYDLIDSLYERIIGDTILLCNGENVYDAKGNYVKTIPVADKYWIVEYNYGEPPPGYLEIVRSFLNGNHVCRGWEMVFKNIFTIEGDGAFGVYLVTSKNNNASIFYTSYSDTLTVSEGLDFQLTIKPQVK